MMDGPKNISLENFSLANGADLQSLGLLFARMLAGDALVMSAKPSPVLVATIKHYRNMLPSGRPITALLRELSSIPDGIQDDGFGKSIFRL